MWYCIALLVAAALASASDVGSSIGANNVADLNLNDEEAWNSPKAVVKFPDIPISKGKPPGLRGATLDPNFGPARPHDELLSLEEEGQRDDEKGWATRRVGKLSSPVETGGIPPPPAAAVPAGACGGEQGPAVEVYGPEGRRLQANRCPPPKPPGPPPPPPPGFGPPVPPPSPAAIAAISLGSILGLAIIGGIGYGIYWCVKTGRVEFRDGEHAWGHVPMYGENEEEEEGYDE
eukprot:GHVU01163870.1.p1 GENE.GHVU01163870.1~~GHVU01163870.1.p1  ORF type:complete len:233 (+),score=26.36 GHVU01163870.1:360-1058(+)